MARTGAQIAEHIERLLTKGRAFRGETSSDGLGAPAYDAWRAQVSTLLKGLRGAEVYAERFDTATTWSMGGTDPKTGVHILDAVREDVESGALNPASLLVSEIFADFLDMAEHLLDQRYKDPAAMLTGAVQEDGLRRMLADVEPGNAPPDNLNNLNLACYKAGIYNKLDMASVQAWSQIRNSAAHGKFGEYDEAHVRGMLGGVRQFLAAHLR
jgi:hypothetical protein